MIAVLTCAYAAKRYMAVTTKILDSSGSGWLNSAVSRRSGRMHVDQAGRHYTTVGGERRAYPTCPPRRSVPGAGRRPRQAALVDPNRPAAEAVGALPSTLEG